MDEIKGIESKATKEVDFLDVLILIMEKKKIVFLASLVGASVAFVTYLVMPPVYMATARILPPQQQQSSAVSLMLGQLGGLAGGAIGIKNPNDLYVGMMQSDTVKNNLIKNFALKDKYGKSSVVDAKKALEDVSSIVSGKDGIIIVSVEDSDPIFSAKIANAYVEELRKLTKNLAITDAQLRRSFFGHQLNDTKNRLANAEVRLKLIQEKTGILQPDGQVTAMIESVAALRATIASKEIQLESMKSFATAENSDYQKLLNEITAAKNQLEKIEKNKNENGYSSTVSLARIPEAGLDYVRALRDVKYYESMFELLAKQFEMAKLDEAKEVNDIQVLDIAKPIDKKTNPVFIYFVLTGFLGGLFGALFFVLMSDFFKTTYFSSQNRIADFKSALKW